MITKSKIDEALKKASFYNENDYLVEYYYENLDGESIVAFIENFIKSNDPDCDVTISASADPLIHAFVITAYWEDSVGFHGAKWLAN